MCTPLKCTALKYTAGVNERRLTQHVRFSWDEPKSPVQVNTLASPCSKSKAHFRLRDLVCSVTSRRRGTTHIYLCLWGVVTPCLARRWIHQAVLNPQSGVNCQLAKQVIWIPSSTRRDLEVSVEIRKKNNKSQGSSTVMFEKMIGVLNNSEQLRCTVFNYFVFELLPNLILDSTFKTPLTSVELQVITFTSY